jgi:AcrR family transcriptional regulator
MQSLARSPEPTEIPDRPLSEPPQSSVRAVPRPLLERRGPGTYDRTKTSEQRRDEQRRALIEAAAHVFARDGYARASVASIIEVAGLSRGTFYRHFDDLADVFMAVRRQASEIAQQAVADAIAGEDDPVAQLRAGIRAFLHLLVRYGDLARVFLRAGAPEPREHEHLHRASVDRFVELLRGGVERALQMGLIHRMPDDLLIYAVAHAIEGTAIRRLEMHEEHLAPEAETVLLELCMRVFR